MSRSRKPRRIAGLPPLLLQVIDAADHTDRNNEEANRGGHAEALTKFGRLAAVTVPARGVLAPSDDDVYTAIDRIACDDLGLKKANQTLEAALQDVDRRSVATISSAVSEVVSVHETAYYYVGLACGLTLAGLPSER